MATNAWIRTMNNASKGHEVFEVMWAIYIRNTSNLFKLAFSRSETPEAPSAFSPVNCWRLFKEHHLEQNSAPHASTAECLTG
jgi:hypothetical protein